MTTYWICTVRDCLRSPRIPGPRRPQLRRCEDLFQCEGCQVASRPTPDSRSQSRRKSDSFFLFNGSVMGAQDEFCRPAFRPSLSVLFMRVDTHQRMELIGRSEYTARLRLDRAVGENAQRVNQQMRLLSRDGNRARPVFFFFTQHNQLISAARTLDRTRNRCPGEQLRQQKACGNNSRAEPAPEMWPEPS